MPAALALIMLGMGLTLTVEDFRRVVRFPKAVAVGLVAQILLLPLLGYALTQVLPLSYGLAAGLMILALCPGGPTASLITFLARGDAALSVTLTATSSVITLVSTPVGLALALAALGGEGQRVSLPVGQTVAFLFAITLVPVALGMLIKAKRPTWAAAGETPFKLFGLVVLVIIIFAALVKERHNVIGFFAQAGVAALLLNVLAFAMGVGLAMLFRLTRPQAICVAVDTGNCNGTLSVAIAATILKQPEMAITPAVYSLLMLAVGGAVIFTAPRLGRRLLKTEPIGARSLADLLRIADAKFADNVAMSIPMKGGTYQTITYRELHTEARRYAEALRELGLQRGDKLAILSENSSVFAFADWGAQGLGVVVVPIFPTLPAESVRYIVEHAEAKIALVGSAEQGRKLDGLTGIQAVRLTGPGSLEELAAGAAPMDLSAWNAAIDQTGDEDLATLIYTSGTTGQPKGVMIPHRVYIHICDQARQALPFDRNEVFLSFLPMSHIYERVCGQVFPISIGASIAFSRGLASLAHEMREVKPTVMLCVPRFLEATMERLLDTADKLPRFDRALFHLALRQGVRRARGQFAPLAAVLDMLVLSNVRDRLGGNFRYFASGGAALPQHVAEFYLALGFTILQGYGLTETGGGSFINRPRRNKYWTVGEPLGMEAKLADDGEILIRGRGLMLGYYKDPEATRQAIDEEGWFHTGDVGQWEGNNLKITDRKKDLFKLSNGKYVAPQPLENKLREATIVGEAVVFGDGQDMVTALIVPNYEEVRARLPELTATESELAQHADVRALVKEAIDKVNQTLAPYEIVKRFTLLDKPFTIDSGELTPTLKVKRAVVREKYAALLAAMR